MKDLIDRIISVEEELQGRTAEAEATAQQVARAAQDKLKELEREFENRFVTDRENRIRDTERDAAKLESELLREAEEKINRKKARVLSRSEEIKKRVSRTILEI